MIAVLRSSDGIRQPARAIYRDASVPLFYALLFVLFLFVRIQNLTSWPWAVTFFPLYLFILFLSVSLLITFRNELSRMDGGRPSILRTISYYVVTLSFLLVQVVLINLGLELPSSTSSQPFPPFTLAPTIAWGVLTVIWASVWAFQARNAYSGGKNGVMAASQSLIFAGLYAIVQTSFLMVGLHADPADANWGIWLSPSFVALSIIVLLGLLGVWAYWKESPIYVPDRNQVRDYSRTPTPEDQTSDSSRSNGSGGDAVRRLSFSPRIRLPANLHDSPRQVDPVAVPVRLPVWVPSVVRELDGVGGACAVICGVPTLVFFVLLSRYLDSKDSLNLAFVFLPLFFAGCILTFVACFRSVTTDHEVESEETSDVQDPLEDHLAFHLHRRRLQILSDLEAAHNSAINDGSGTNTRTNDRPDPLHQRRRALVADPSSSATLGSVLASNPLLFRHFLLSLHRAMVSEENGGSASPDRTASVEQDYLRLLLATIARASRPAGPVGVDAQLLDMLPTFFLDDKSFLVAGSHTCNICLSEFQPGDEVRTLPCFHFFHKSEIDQWLSRNNSCPLCKRPIDEQELSRATQVSAEIGGSPENTLRIMEEAQSSPLPHAASSPEMFATTNDAGSSAAMGPSSPESPGSDDDLD